MRKVYLIGMILLASVIAMAQQDEKAKEILNKASEKNRSYKSMAADFVFSMKNVEMEIDEKNQGSIKIKGQKYCVELPDVGMKMISDGTTLWNYMKDGNQVTISNLEEAGNDLMDPSSLFTIYEQGFKSKFVEEKKVGSKTVYVIDLFPDSDKYDVSKITVMIDESTLMIQSALLYGTDENLYGIEVNKMETNKNFPDSDFIFDSSKYDDIEEIDLR
jgi:outer membrane lipoprotein-sorting protein